MSIDEMMNYFFLQKGHDLEDGRGWELFNEQELDILPGVTHALQSPGSD